MNDTGLGVLVAGIVIYIWNVVSICRWIASLDKRIERLERRDDAE